MGSPQCGPAAVPFFVSPVSQSVKTNIAQKGGYLPQECRKLPGHLGVSALILSNRQGCAGCDLLTAEAAPRGTLLPAIPTRADMGERLLPLHREHQNECNRIILLEVARSPPQGERRVPGPGAYPGAKRLHLRRHTSNRPNQCRVLVFCLTVLRRYSPKYFNAIWMPSSYIFWKSAWNGSPRLVLRWKN
jgi:hypothetical protein